MSNNQDPDKPIYRKHEIAANPWMCMSEEDLKKNKKAMSMKYGYEICGNCEEKECPGMRFKTVLDETIHNYDKNAPNNINRKLAYRDYFNNYFELELEKDYDTDESEEVHLTPYGDRCPLNFCVVFAIREKFPNDNGLYMGFTKDGKDKTKKVEATDIYRNPIDEYFFYNNDEKKWMIEEKSDELKKRGEEKTYRSYYR